MTESAFFQDLAVLMALAGLVAVVFGRLGWPKVIGYLFAGIIISGNTWGGSFLVDPASVQTIGQLGIVFLMFTLGLEFSASEMKRAKNVSVPIALVDTAVMIWLGYTVGTRVLGWGSVASLFLGASICDSATTLLAKTIDEMKWSARPFVRYVLSTSVCEDILCVGVIALITGVAHGRGMSLGAVGMSLGALAVFFTAVVVFGLVLVPRLLDRVAKTHDREALLLALLGCCFFVTYLAFKLDFQLALGAFLVGVLGSSADARRELNELVAPLRNMFAAVFFITIGCLVDPAVCWHHAPVILGLAALVMVGKTFNCFSVSILTGRPVKESVQIAFGLAQIGEFAYMVALLYLSLANDPSSPMYQVVVGVSLLTTCLNPLMLRLSDPAGDRLERALPAVVHGWLTAYRDWLLRFSSRLTPSAVRSRLRSRVVTLGVVAMLNAAVFFTAEALVRIDYGRFSLFFEDHKRAFICLAADLAFFAGVMSVWRLATGLAEDLATVVGGAGLLARVRFALERLVAFVVRTAVFAFFALQIVMINVTILPPDRYARMTMFAALALIGVLGWRRFRIAGRLAGRRFKFALAAERRQEASAPRLQQGLVLPSDFHASVELDAASPVCGRTIRELDIRAKTGATLVRVTRAGVPNRNPGPDWRFAAGDTAVAIGDPDQLAALRALFGVSR